MLKSKRFEPIREIVANSASDLSRAMSDAARRVADLERQLEQLKQYREEYVRNSTSSAPQGGTMDAVKLQNYRAFLARLGEAMRQHLVNLDHARADYDKRRARWTEKRVEAESLGRAVDRFRQQESHALERREQNEGDDAAMRIAIAASSKFSSNSGNS